VLCPSGSKKIWEEMEEGEKGKKGSRVSASRAGTAHALYDAFCISSVSTIFTHSNPVSLSSWKGGDNKEGKKREKKRARQVDV